MTKYNSNYDPPAPIAYISLKKVDSRTRLHDVEMLLDTGADVTILPLSFIKDLGLEPSSDQRYILAGFDGSTILSEIYNLQVIFLGKRFTGNYCVIDDPVGILGRDILNQISILFDGPNSEWDEIPSIKE